MNSKIRIPDFNNVVLIGRLTKDPKLEYTQKTGQAVCTFSIAVNRNYKDASGEWAKETTYVPVRVWRDAAKRCSERLKKGSPVLVSGRLRTLKWEDKEGNPRSMLEVEAQRVQFMEFEGEQGVSQEMPQESGYAEAESTQEKPASPESEEEIPF
ncbi:MAG: single-stranded DNA-binding protein [Elusimicrobiota bacterium]